MEQMNFHKLKLYSLIAAAVALIALLLPWVSFSFLGYSTSSNGLRGWGFLSLIGIAGVAALSFMGDKGVNYTADFKKYVLFSFGAVILGALLFFFRINSYGVVEAGIGLWICLAAGLAGLALHLGFIKVDDKKVV